MRPKLGQNRAKRGQRGQMEAKGAKWGKRAKHFDKCNMKSKMQTWKKFQSFR